MTMEIQKLMWRMEGIVEAFRTAAYVARDVEAALAAFVDDGELANLPAATGGRTGAEIRRYLAEELVPHLPDDLTVQRVTRTSDQRRVVEESTVAFTHDREMPWLLPGVAPTHRRAEVLAVSVVSFQHRSSMGTTTSRIRQHRTLWDHMALVRQLDLDPAAVAPAPGG